MKYITLFLILTYSFALQDRQIPPYKGKDEHSKGQPSWCQNYKDSMVKANCDCQPHLGDQECHKDKNDEDYVDPRDMPSRCKTSCRRDACRCESGCTS